MTDTTMSRAEMIEAFAEYLRITERATTHYARAAAALAQLRAESEAQAVAWMTHHDEPLLFPTEYEAGQYCDDDERPIPLYAADGEGS